jgi:hypothetical protein
VNNELSRTSAVTNGTAIASYLRDGLYLPTSPIEEYVVFRIADFSGMSSFVYPGSDLRLISIQSDNPAASYQLMFTDLNNMVVLNHAYQALVIDPNYLILPKGFKCTFNPIQDVTALTIVAKQCSVISTIQIIS